MDCGPYYERGTEPRPEDRPDHDWEFWARQQEEYLRRRIGGLFEVLEKEFPG